LKEIKADGLDAKHPHARLFVKGICLLVVIYRNKEIMLFQRLNFSLKNITNLDMLLTMQCHVNDRRQTWFHKLFATEHFGCTKPYPGLQ